MLESWEESIRECVASTPLFIINNVGSVENMFHSRFASLFTRYPAVKKREQEHVSF